MVLYSDALSTIFAVACATTPLFQMTDLGTLGGTESRALDVNDAGHVVGWSTTGDLAPPPHSKPITRAFHWDGKSLLELPPFETDNPYYSAAHALNDRGQIVGTTYGTNSAAPTLWENGQPIAIGWSFCEANSINNRGTVVGTCPTDTGTSYTFIWTAESGMKLLIKPKHGLVQHDVRSINNAGVVAGGEHLAHQAFLWDAGTINVLAEASTGTIANAVNDQNHAVVTVGQPFSFQAFLYRDSMKINLPTLGGQSIFALDLNETDWVVGASESSLGGLRAFLNIDGVTHDLNDLTQNSEGWFLESATAISDTGFIAGYAITPNGDTHAYLLTPIIPVYGDITGDGFVNVDDLLAVINSWGACPAPPQACPADIAPIGPPMGDGVVNVDDLLAVINNWN